MYKHFSSAIYEYTGQCCPLSSADEFNLWLVKQSVGTCVIYFVQAICAMYFVQIYFVGQLNLLVVKQSVGYCAIYLQYILCKQFVQYILFRVVQSASGKAKCWNICNKMQCNEIQSSTIYGSSICWW